MRIPEGMIPAEDHEFSAALPERIVAVDQRVAHCRSCGKDIIWTLNSNGKKEPMDYYAKTKSGQMVSHFVTCPNAKWHRKSRA